MDPHSISVALVEDNGELRGHLASIINGAEGFRVEGSYPTAEEAIRLLPSHPADVALIDIQLPKLSGVDCVRRLRAILPSLQALMFTVYEDSDKIFAALEAGACGYLLKRTPPDEMLNAIREVHQGGSPMSGFIARKVVQSFRKMAAQSASSLAKLSAREEEILSFVAKGFHNKEIGVELHISTETVRVHLRNIYEKLHVNSRSEAVVKFLTPADRSVPASPAASSRSEGSSA